MKKFIIGILLCGLVLSAFSCNKQDEEVQSDIVESNPVEEEQLNEEYYTSDLSDERYDGYNYRILVRKGSIGKQYFDEPQDDVINDAIYLRNKAVEERFGVTISCYESEESNTDTSALNGILAGDDAYDLILTHSRSAFAYAVQGAAMNINDISTIHTEKPWWSKDLTDNCNLNGRLYILGGDYSINALSHSMCLFFNKRIFDELGLEYPYELVNDGEWTFDEFSYLARKGGSDLNGDGVMTTGDDRFGFIAQEWYTPISILYAGGERIYAKNDEGIVELALYSNKTVDIFDSFFSLMDNEACHLQLSDEPWTDSFRNGKAMFIDGGLGSASSYRSMDDDFGVLPYPKFDEEDDYHTTFNAVADLGIIPITVTDAERTGAVTEALCAYGSMYVVPAFYDVNLKTKSARDDESEAMMDIIREGLVYDIAYLAGSVYGDGGKAIYRMANGNFSSWYAASESAAQNAVKQFNRDYAGVE